jgi:hypothetical protein
LANRKALQTHGDALDQGDILSDVPLVRWKDGQAAQGSPNRAIITSHGCVCEDYDRAVKAGKSSAADRVFIQVAPLRPAKDFRDKIDLIREGKLLDYFFIEGDGSKLAHQVADLKREQPIPAHVLADCKRVARIADWQWNALLVHMTVSRFRSAPADIFHPDLLKAET